MTLANDSQRELREHLAAHLADIGNNTNRRALLEFLMEHGLYQAIDFDLPLIRLMAGK